jgi:hypothetical protein
MGLYNRAVSSQLNASGSTPAKAAAVKNGADTSEDEKKKPSMSF